jgi:hypothetical protein
LFISNLDFALDFAFRLNETIWLPIQRKGKGQHHQQGQQSSLFVNPLAATPSITIPISLEWDHSYFEVLIAVVTIFHDNF